MIPFLKYTKVYFLFSALLIIISAFAVFRYGFNYSIDFLGGSVIEYSFTQEVPTETIRTAFQEHNLHVRSIQETGPNTVLITSDPVPQEIEETMRLDFAEDPSDIERLRYETVGPSLGQETIYKTALASLAAAVGILLYMSFTFSKWTYGLAALIAMLHDLAILMGIYALLGVFTGAEVDVLFVTAVLTTMSFSVHDTIVMFDKVREHRRIESQPIALLADKALTETIVRSLNNSLTIVLMLIPLVIMGGESIQHFASALLVGTLVGTYSSPFVATPLLVLLERRR